LKRDFDQIITNLDDTPVKLERKEGDESEPKDMTIAVAISQALLMNQPDGKNMRENITRYHLAKKVYKGGVQTIKDDELTLAKEAVGKVFGPLVTGQVDDWVNNDYHENGNSVPSEVPTTTEDPG